MIRRVAPCLLVILAACSSGDPKESWDDGRPDDAPLNATRVETQFGVVWVTSTQVFAKDCDVIEKLDAKGLLESTVIPPREAKAGYVCG